MTIAQLNRIRLDAQSFRIYVCLLCEGDMSVNRIAAKTGITWKTINKKLPKLEAKGLIVKTNNRSKVYTYTGVDHSMENNPSTMENNLSKVVENDRVVEENELTVMENDPVNREIYEKYS